MAQGIDLEEMPAPRLIHVLMNFFIEDGMLEKDHLEARDKARAQLLISMSSENPGYDSTEEEYYGRSNDIHGGASSEPLPFIPLTEQTEDGYVGLLPPLA